MCVYCSWFAPYNRGEVIKVLRIERDEYVNRTFRMNKKLVDRMEQVCNAKNISLNKLMVICVEYALDNLEEDEPEQ